MLNVLLAMLLAINAVFWLWTQNHLAILGWTAPAAEQGAAMAGVPIAPERIQAENPGDANAPLPATRHTIDTTAAPKEWACWRLGPFSPSSLTRLQSAMPLNSDDLRWSIVDTVLPQRWVVVSERSANAQALDALVKQAKSQQLDHRTSDTDVLRGRLILGTFINRDLAVNALSHLLDQGWGPLSVMRERPPLPALLLQTHVASAEALTRTQQTVAKIPVMGQPSLQVLACDEPAPEASPEPAAKASASAPAPLSASPAVAQPTATR